jgi:hypothetical protein
MMWKCLDPQPCAEKDTGGNELRGRPNRWFLFAKDFMLFLGMTANQVDYMNIGLMLVALVAAFLLPFEVFLFSYAILGPLHYLTEISWLHDRQYFAPKKLDWIPLAIIGVVILLGARSVMGEDIVNALSSIGLGPAMEWIDKYVYDITFLSFGLAFIFVAFKDWTYRIVAIMFLLLAAYIFALPEPVAGQITTQQQLNTYISKHTSPFFKIFAVYLPTLVHVYLFTGAFILFGALKRKSNAGYVSFAAFVLCALACFFIFPNPTGYAVSDWAVTNYTRTFLGLNKYLVTDFGNVNFLDTESVNYFTDPLSLKLTRFIAFAYTYHYLNWFSKTSIIRWHKVPKLRFAIVIVAWVASVVLYLADYNNGFRWLFLLSFLHVLLEFPLNHLSFIGIGQELYARITGKSTPAKA